MIKVLTHWSNEGSGIKVPVLLPNNARFAMECGSASGRLRFADSCSESRGCGPASVC